MRLRNKETGETGYLELEKGDDEKYTGLRVYKNDFMYKRYDSLAGVLEEWEDYKPAEPLIKDEKIRKAVRAWAEANGFAKLGFVKWADNHWLLRAENEDGHEFDIDFFDNGCKKLPKYEYATFYTIAELCGEEEE